jgi:hypothetical protein
MGVVERHDVPQASIATLVRVVQERFHVLNQRYGDVVTDHLRVGAMQVRIGPDKDASLVHWELLHVIHEMLPFALAE